MKIKINDEYAITSAYGSSVNLIKYTSRTRESDGEKYVGETVIGSYISVDQALGHYARHLMNSSDKEYDNIKQYIKEYRELTQSLLGILKE